MNAVPPNETAWLAEKQIPHFVRNDKSENTETNVANANAF
jgi:hypothetical protein